MSGGLPKGSMDNVGYLNLSAKAVHLLPTHHHSSNPNNYNLQIREDHEAGQAHITAEDRSIWQIDSESKDTNSH